VVIGFGRSGILSSVLLWPRQDQSNGWIKGYRINVSNDGKSWTTTARGDFDRSDRLKTVRFGKPVLTRFLKLVAESSFDGQPFASLAELSVIEERGAFCGGTR
jgi:beta-galactosidase